jgi:hypothetical protein
MPTTAAPVMPRFLVVDDEAFIRSIHDGPLSSVSMLDPMAAPSENIWWS